MAEYFLSTQYCVLNTNDNIPNWECVIQLTSYITLTYCHPEYCVLLSYYTNVMC